jgi:hypothetical protein
MVEPRQVVEALGHIGMVGPQHLLSDGQGTLKVGLGFCILRTPFSFMQRLILLLFSPSVDFQ